VSNPLTVRAAGTAGAEERGAGAGVVAADRIAMGAAAARGAAVGAAGAACAGAMGAAPAPVGPPGGRVGNLIVGAAVGLGGKLMRTVSFFG